MASIRVNKCLIPLAVGASGNSAVSLFLNKVTFLNNNGGMRFEELEVKAFTGLSIEFKTEEKHQPYTENGDRWALLQRFDVKE